MSEYGNLCTRAYQSIGAIEASGRKPEEEFLVKFEASLEDKPGSLANFLSLIARKGDNIGLFHYNRSVDSNRVVVEAQSKKRNSLQGFLGLFRRRDFYSVRKERDEIEIAAPESILEIRVRLVNEAGSLASFALLLREHQANVIYMFYNESIDPKAADIVLTTRDPGEVNNLLNVINSSGYHYKVVYRGSDVEEVERTIGLNLVEKLFMRLHKLISNQGVQELMVIVESSKKLSDDLVCFCSEMGNHFRTADILESILTYASTFITKVGSNFHIRGLPTLKFNENVQLFTFRPPTGGNIFVFRHGDQMAMFEAGHGLYYEDIKRLLKRKGIDPGRVKWIFISHNDADHVGTAGYFMEEFGTKVFMHLDGKGIIDNENRAYGANTKLSKLNKHLTILVGKFTKCKYPEKLSFFSTSTISGIGAFNVIDTFTLGSLEFQVLESHGGHIPTQAFFLNREYGLFFTSDYLINVGSLLAEEREYMKLPRRLMTSTNNKSDIFKEETMCLVDVISLLDKELKSRDESVLVFPGHGDYYRCRGQFPFSLVN